MAARRPHSPTAAGDHCEDQGDLRNQPSPRLAIAGPYEELNELGETLDDLLARLEASFASQRNFVSNASHELRTPLTAERALLQVALADPHPSVESLQTVCEALVELGGQQERLIDDLLTWLRARAASRALSASTSRPSPAGGPDPSRRGVALAG